MSQAPKPNCNSSRSPLSVGARGLAMIGDKEDKEGDKRDHHGHRKNESDKKEKKDKRGKREKPPVVVDAKAAAQRYKLVQELLSSERAHGDNLTSVVNNYLKPLSEQAIISKTDVADLFCNIELVRNWSVAFREDLEELLGPKLDGEFGERFEEMLPLLRQLYTQYNENYEQALATYEKLKRENKKFQDFISEKTSAGGKDLLSYLYLPIQRLLAYEALLKEILELTPSYDLDYAHLIASLQQLRDTEIHANNRAKLKKNIDKVLAIQNAVSGVSNLALPHRRFIYEAALQIMSGGRGHERWLYLFNDVLLCARMGRHKGKPQLEVAFIEPLETLKVEDVEDTPDQKHAWRTISPANEYVFCANYYADKSTWLTLIRDAIRLHVKTKTAQQQVSPAMQEEIPRDLLVSRILNWSKRADAEVVMKEIRDLAVQLEKKKKPP